MYPRRCRLFDVAIRPSRSIDAEIVRDLPPEQLEECELNWSPSRDELKLTLRNEGIAIEHEHWNWRQKQISVHHGRHRIVAVIANGEIQGLMAVLGFGRTSRLTRDNEVLYVDYIESAPWNIRKLGDRPQLAPIGKVLLAEAIQFSFEMGFDGRIGLHSLPKAEPFYRTKVGLVEIGRDWNYDGLNYFEFDSISAKKWFQKVTS